MKKYLMLLVCVIRVYGLHAQTFQEFFQQNKTHKKYLIKQIAALQSYIGLARKGYGIVSDGLHFISDLKNGTFSLDKDYFSSLSTISPAVKKDNNIAHTISLQASINDLYNKAKQGEQSAYLSSVCPVRSHCLPV